MDKPCGIIVFGANGSGKTTLGREIARILSFKSMDHEDYAFTKSETPYTMQRSHEECIELMLADILRHRQFVVSAVTGDFGDIIPQFYALAVYISAPLELRLRRYEQREYERYGERILKGGDMYEAHIKFREFIATRSLSKIEKWGDTLLCPVIRIDGTEGWCVNAQKVSERFDAETARIKQ